MTNMKDTLRCTPSTAMIASAMKSSMQRRSPNTASSDFFAGGGQSSAAFEALSLALEMAERLNEECSIFDDDSDDEDDDEEVEGEPVRK